MTGALPELRELLAEVSDLDQARALLAWDKWTQMPRGGAETRAEQLATLAGVSHERLASDHAGRLIEAAERETAGEPFDSEPACLTRMARRDWEKARRVPPELRAERARSAARAEHAWAAARSDSDFAAFLPHLRRNVELARRHAECFEGFERCERPYDALLDDYEPGLLTSEIATLLDPLRDRIPPLIEAAAAAGDADASCLHGEFPLDRQRELVLELVERLPFEPGTWRLDETTHPFATAISPGDVRLATRYDEGYVGCAIWSTLHEAGHGLYEAGFPAELGRGPLWRAPSLGLHESQSRFWENFVGRSRPYTARLLEALRRAFPDRFGAVSPEQLYRAANRVERTLIRTEADPVTYPLHIALRFELEVAIFEDDLELGDLPEVWRSRTADLLGIEVPDDASGVLQDVHWASGSFGYFPTYTVGDVIAAQLWEDAGRDIADLEERIAAGELVPLREWLAGRLHRHAGMFLPRDTLERALREPLSVEPYLAQLGARVAEVYGVAVP